jgi:catechol 2,3-dioxygenase-like lactoylglutathione lyase family enzyme
VILRVALAPALALGVLLTCACAARPSAPPDRPPTSASRGRLTGIDHVSFVVSDLAAARGFYGDLLGLTEVPSFHDGAHAGGHAGRDRGPARTAFRVGARQRIEIEQGSAAEDGRLAHVAFTALGLPPGRWSFVRDPDGHRLEIVGAARSGDSSEATEREPAGDQLRLIHVGLLAGSLRAALAFYRGQLGFQEFWRGGSDPRRLDWVNLRVPAGEDYVELMLYDQLPAPDARGGKNHVCIFVSDVAAAVAAIEARPARQQYHRAIEPKVGRNRKRQVNLFDPDGTRVELMEPQTVDGQPAEPSTAPPPRP